MFIIQRSVSRPTYLFFITLFRDYTFLLKPFSLPIGYFESGRMSGVSTLFIIANSLPATQSTDFVGGLELCKAMEDVVGFGNVEGSIRISGLWRLQVRNEKARATLLTHGLTIRGVHVTVLSKNPYMVDDQETVKLIVGNLPFSISNEEIEKTLVSLGAKLASKMMWEHYREPKDPGNPNKIPGLTSFKNGRRFIFIAKPEVPLPLTAKVAVEFSAFLYYKGQKEAIAEANAAADAAAFRAKVFFEAAAVARARINGNHRSADADIDRVRSAVVNNDEVRSVDSDSSDGQSAGVAVPGNGDASLVTASPSAPDRPEPVVSDTVGASASRESDTGGLSAKNDTPGKRTVQTVLHVPRGRDFSKGSRANRQRGSSGSLKRESSRSTGALHGGPGKRREVLNDSVNKTSLFFKSPSVRLEAGCSDASSRAAPR